MRQGGALLPVPGRILAPTGLAVPQYLLRHGLADDGDGQRAGSVAIIEIAPGQNRQPQHREVAGRDDEIDRPCRIRSHRPPFDLDRPDRVVAAAGGRDPGGDAGGFDIRLPAERVERTLPERRLCLGVPIPFAGERQAGREHVVGREAVRNGSQADQRPRQQTGHHEQHDRERDFGRNEPAAQQPPAATRHRAGVEAQRLGEVGP